MMKNHIMKYTTFLFLFLVFISGCATPQDNVINIGFIGPLTGDIANYGESSLGGITLALEEINKQGIHGKKINIIAEDGQCKGPAAILAAQKLITIDKVHAIIVTCSPELLAIAPIAKESDVLIISQSASHPDITNAGDHVFRTWPSDIGQGKKIADKLIQDGKQKIGILNPNSDYNVALANALTKSFEAKGGKVIIHEMYEQDEKDFRTPLTKIKAANVDALYLVPFGEGGLLMKQARQLGILVPFYASETVGTPEIVRDAGGTEQGVIYATPAFDESSGLTKNFLDSYEQKYSKEPSFGVMAASAYDAMHLLAKAIEHGEDVESMQSFMHNVKNYPGAAGTLTIDKNGDALKEFQLMTIQDGEFVRVKE